MLVPLSLGLTIHLVTPSFSKKKPKNEINPHTNLPVYRRLPLLKVVTGETTPGNDTRFLSFHLLLRAAPRLNRLSTAPSL